MNTHRRIESEAQARTMTACPCCDGPKIVATLVCWRCFKVETPSGYAALKWSGEDWETWLMKARDA